MNDEESRERPRRRPPEPAGFAAEVVHEGPDEVPLEAFIRRKVAEGKTNGRPVSEKMIDLFRRKVLAAGEAPDLDALWKMFWGEA